MAGVQLGIRVLLLTLPSLISCQTSFFYSTTDYSITRVNYPDCNIPERFQRGSNISLKCDRDLDSMDTWWEDYLSSTIPPCLKRLQVKCISEKTGFMETPRWKNGLEYFSETGSCVTLPVPVDHVTMISLISLDLELKNGGFGCYDKLAVFFNGLCLGPGDIVICTMADLPPMVLEGHSVLSFGFVSDGSVQRKGFRLVYSFHKASLTPYKLPNGKWDCSDRYYPNIKQHFACLAGAYCSNERDKLIDCPAGNECGTSLIRLKDRCFRYFDPSESLSWNQAADSCRNYGGNLAVLNSPEKWDSSKEFFSNLPKQSKVFVGLEIAPADAPEMYLNTWMWSDQTLALYANLTFTSTDPPLCAVARTSAPDSLKIVTCDEKSNAGYLCDSEFKVSGNTAQESVITLPIPSTNWDTRTMTMCPKLYFTHNFLSCDVASACRVSSSQDTNVCSQKADPPIPFFACKNGVERVPYTLVCDFRSDCCDGSDEDFCLVAQCEGRKNFQCADGRQCIPASKVCDKRSDCVDKSDEVKCRQRLTEADLVSNTVLPPAVIDFDGFGKFTVSPLKTSPNGSDIGFDSDDTDTGSGDPDMDDPDISINIPINNFIKTLVSGSLNTFNSSPLNTSSSRSVNTSESVSLNTTHSLSLNTSGSSSQNTSDTSGSGSQDTSGSGSMSTSNESISVKSFVTCPETHFLCGGIAGQIGFCLPVYVRCNGINDCVGSEDEVDCDNYTCPGFYRCRNSLICVHQYHLCDTRPQCPERDDELMCNFTCPESCYCYGQAFICSGPFDAPLYPQLRYLDGTNSGIQPDSLVNNTKLVHLSLRNCGITVFQQLDFPNLRKLDLSHNNLLQVDSGQFSQLRMLHSISLASVYSVSMKTLFNTGLPFSRITELNLSGLRIPAVDDTFFSAFPALKYLNMSNSRLREIGHAGFRNLEQLTVLDLRGCPMTTFFPGVFAGLYDLAAIYTDNYKLCCPQNLPLEMTSEDCHAPSNEVSSCDALLRSAAFRVFLTLYAFLALAGNAGSFVYRVFIEKGANKMGYEVFVSHLSVADFLMGVYLAIIGIADRLYFGNYRWNDTRWKESAACKVAGFLSLLSGELSAFIICLITLERLLVIGFPHRNLRFSRLSAHAACMLFWVAGLVLAAVPLLPMMAHWDFYGQSGICIPLPITRKKFGGQDYAFGVMIILNFVIFLFIAVGQVLIYWFIRANTIGCKESGRKSKDMAVARRLLAVVMTNFMCWFPICLLGTLARSGVPISSQINVAIAIFVLPFNSALNPFLYTLQVVLERRHRSRRDTKSRKESRGPHSVSNSVDLSVVDRVTKATEVETEASKFKQRYSKEEAFQLFDKFLNDGLITPEQVRHRVWDIYEG